MAEALEKLSCPECLAELWLAPESIEQNALTECSSCHRTFEARHALPAESDPDPQSPPDSGSVATVGKTQGAATGTTLRIRLEQVSRSPWEQLLQRLEALAQPVRDHPLLAGTVLLTACLFLALLGTTLPELQFLVLHTATLMVLLLAAVSLRQDVYGPVNLILLAAFELLGVFRYFHAAWFLESDFSVLLVPLLWFGGHLFFVTSEDLDHL